MVSEEITAQLKKMYVKPGKKVDLAEFATSYKGANFTKEEAQQLLNEGLEHLAVMQDKLYAHNRYSILIVLQAMDAAGKDSTIKHILSGLNPTGVKVHSFKTPSSQELDHDYLWRHALALPARGEIAIHNRSHYENVLVTRVHPEYILNENLPGILATSDIDEDFWQQRFKQINRFEKNLFQNGTIILKFFLHVSKKEQKKRFLERIDNPSKNWKFSFADIKERAHWDEYQKAYEQALQETAQDHAPWFVIPADDKWYARLAIASVIYNQFETLTLEYPTVTPKQKEELTQAKAILMAELEEAAKSKS
ncbi:MAG TPA: polyphosphate kinase 2 family protein [Ohtaekwangia sp.]|uniref:polyphosphate kinase 2 family protein n=1 Tax=Ohtaekwangia sp. TaxID=2066019 RepID=UPI002F954E5F